MIIFRLPDGVFHTCYGEGGDSVAFHTFGGERSSVFKGKFKPLSADEIRALDFKQLPATPEFSQESREDYLEKINRAIGVVNENQLQKIVIARKIGVDFNDINISESFLNLSKNYPNAFVYFFRDESQSWIGAFSELLGKFDKKSQKFTTMSLAGTLPVEEQWTPKEIEEQAPVTDFILKILRQYADDVEVSETYDHISGSIKHLRTDFSADINLEDLETLISELHPTPAVCGFPKDLCKSAIKSLENFNRELYAGYSRTETETAVYYFVNLRCAKLFRNRAMLFAGGGITSKSLPQKEWRETELKSRAILDNLAIF
ncbi:isochorismate synthase [Cruoricaptor ignavus]|uniref:Isochorismate synthase n=1 Tax=Cruoricaptor ignavus TaxID=1118202 RepID=A0A1M6EYT7_9FLAO|nr:isochorismate synthase [Cruoricaptor ignavus]